MLANAVKQLSKHSTIYVSAIAFNKSASFLVIPLVTAYIGTVENYGVKEIAEVTIALMIQVLGFNVFQGMVRYLADEDDPDRRGALLCTSLLLVAGTTGSVLLLSLVFAEPFAALLFGSAEYAPAMRVTAGILFFSVFTRWSYAYLQAQQKSMVYALLTSSKILFEIALKVVFLVFMDLTYMGVLYSVFLGEILFGTGMAIALLYRHPKGISREFAKRLLSFIAPLLLSGICMFVVHQGDRFLIRIFDGLDGTGFYGLGYKFGSIVNTLVYTGFATIWFPFIYKVKEEAELRELFPVVMTAFIALASFMTLLLSAFGPEVTRLMVAAPFRESAAVLPLIAFSYLFWIVYQILHTIFFIRERTKFVLAIAFSVAVVNTGLNLLLLPHFGYIAAAWSTMAAYFTAAVAAYFLAQRIFRIPYDLGRLVGAIGLAFVLWVLTQIIEFESAVTLVIAKIAICLAYPLVLLFSGYLTEPLRHGLRDTLRGIRSS